MPYLFICVKMGWCDFLKLCFTDSYINCSCQGPKGYCKNEDDGLSLQRKNEHEMKIKTNINPYNRHVMKRLLMISWLFTLGWTLATAQENDSIKHKDTRKCIIFSDYEQQPSFPGGMQALREYLKENTHWPLGHEEDCISGRVVVCFVVEKDGSITHAKVVRSLAPAFDAEALRVARNIVFPSLSDMIMMWKRRTLLRHPDQLKRPLQLNHLLRRLTRCLRQINIL